MAIRYFMAEESVRNGQQQDCCLIVEVHTPDWIDDQLSWLAAEATIEAEFGRRLTLYPANKDEAHQLVQEESEATHGCLKLGSGDPLYWHLLPIV
ncbi:MAG TPA: hypothetical protein VFO40_14000 [Chthoniobacterales bacterium]|nr:hypothetical protein [Chthoniobacterales bacterium]